MTIEQTTAHDPLDAICACPGCNGVNPAFVDDASLDPLAGTTHTNGKAIWTADQIAAHLNRTGGGFADGFGNDTLNGRQNNLGDGNDVITFGFFNTQSQLFTNGYVYSSGGSLFGLAEYFNFAPMTAAQRAATREAMQAWDDVVAVSFREVSADDADMNFGNLASAPTTQAYARIPTSGLDATLGGQVREIGGDSWISASQASNFQLDEGGYGMQTLLHEAGHAIGISHPGAYNGTGNYTTQAEYAQDTRAYSVMSYFNASTLGGRHFDFNISGTVFSAVPLIHDIAAAQRIYGADMTTRTGDDTYGFNSNVNRDTFDFTKTPAPIGAIWDAGGIDTIDASGYATKQLIDLTAGSLSSIGGVTFDTAPSFEQVLANRTAAGFSNATYTRAIYDANMAALAANPEVGRLTDNFGIAYGVTIENAIGGSGADKIIGNGVDNKLVGNAGSDELIGKEGNDTLDGGTGNDLMLGGVGNDTFVVGEAGDVVTENAGEGSDTVLSAIDYTLGDNLENLTLTGAATTGTGNGLDNVITGNALANLLTGGAGDDRLAGGDGVDRLVGGEGADTFVAELNSSEVATKRGSLSIDMILDFDAAQGDRIDLSGLGEFTFIGKADGKQAGDLSYKSFGNVNAAEAAMGIDLDGIDGKGANDPVSILFGHTDDDGIADFAIVLFDTSSVTGNDLMLGGTHAIV